ncbi:MAG TPA: hypothetical protein VGS97_14050 [Actinocrinis sp.]|uniref:hypothetical protein n=1 Tax=Actinocrinis sp. TaxID=1920516 RepID=UPI002DDCFD40|nr:hypothetical protein [Actinocrinis sp.]HEV2345216.1 hypothetical protein [Actinocrinis sp.]
MKVRLWGLPEENDRVAEALRAAFRVINESEDCPPSHGDSPLRRRFLKLRLDTPAEAEQQ